MKIVSFLGNAVIFLPPSMVERNVLGSNFLRILAPTVVMVGPLSRVPNARKSTSYEGMNECVGKRDSNFAGSNLVRARQNNDFTAGVESQTFPQPDSFKTAASCDHNHRDCWRTRRHQTLRANRGLFILCVHALQIRRF